MDAKTPKPGRDNEPQLTLLDVLRQLPNFGDEGNVSMRRTLLISIIDQLSRYYHMLEEADERGTVSQEVKDFCQNRDVSLEAVVSLFDLIWGLTGQKLIRVGCDRNSFPVGATSPIFTAEGILYEMMYPPNGTLLLKQLTSLMLRGPQPPQDLSR